MAVLSSRLRRCSEGPCLLKPGMLHHVAPWPLVQLSGAGGDELDPAPRPAERAASFEVHVAEVALGAAPGARGTGP